MSLTSNQKGVFEVLWAMGFSGNNALHVIPRIRLFLRVCMDVEVWTHTLLIMLLLLPFCSDRDN